MPGGAPPSQGGEARHRARTRRTCLLRRCRRLERRRRAGAVCACVRECAGSTAASTSVDAGARSRATPAACNGQVGLPAAVCRVDHARRELAVGREQQKPFRRHIKPAHVREALRVRQARRKQQLDDGRQLWAGGVAPPCGQHAARLVERDDPARESCRPARALVAERLPAQRETRHLNIAETRVHVKSPGSLSREQSTCYTLRRQNLTVDY